MSHSRFWLWTAMHWIVVVCVAAVREQTHKPSAALDRPSQPSLIAASGIAEAFGYTWTKHYCKYHKKTKFLTLTPYNQLTGKLVGIPPCSHPSLC